MGNMNKRVRSVSTAFRSYLREVSQVRLTGQATENSYQSALKVLVEVLGGNGVRALNEPAQVACGAPDLVVSRNDVPIGHIECKDVGIDLDRVEDTEQLKRYHQGLPNLVLTNYLEFRWYADGELREVECLGHIRKKLLR